MNLFKLSTLFVFLACVIATGCTSVPLPKYAKANDFVTIPLGGTKTVANSNYLKTSDLNVTVTDSLGQEFPAFVLRLYRVFADPSSRYALASLDPGSELNGVVYPNEGQWMMQFVMPSSNTFGQLPEPGLATIAVISTELNPDPDPKKRLLNMDPKTFNEDLSSIPFEILPGTGGAVISEIRGGQYLTTSPTILARPSDEPGLLNNVAGAVFVYEYTTDSFIDAGLPYLVKTSPDQNIQLLTNRKVMGGNITQMTAIVMNINGFYDDDSWVPGTSYYDGLYLAFSWDRVPYGANVIVDDSNWPDHVALVPSESYYIDTDGNKIDGVTPVLSKVR
jgi:hypothetical protein